MADFNATTAYAGDWAHLNAELVDDVRVERRTSGSTVRSFCLAKAVQMDVTAPGFSPIAAAILGSANETAYRLWVLDNAADPLDPLYATLAPEQDDLIIFDYQTTDEEVWRIVNVLNTRVSNLYNVSASKTNG